MTCAKVRYGSEKGANNALDQIQGVTHRPGEKVPTRAYRCPHCKGWHLTSSVHRRFRRAA